MHFSLVSFFFSVAAWILVSDLHPVKQSKEKMQAFNKSFIMVR